MVIMVVEVVAVAVVRFGGRLLFGGISIAEGFLWERLRLAR